MKILYLILICFVFSSLSVFAGGVGEGESAYVVEVPISLRVVAEDDGTDLEERGTVSSSERIKIYKTVGETEYVLGETTISFRNSENQVSNADLSDLLTDYDADNNIAVLRASSVPRASGTLSMYIPKKSVNNAIVICEGARAASQVSQGCSANSVVTSEVLLFPPNGDETYSFSTYDEAGISYWKVDGIEGTGIQTVSINLGGGSDPSNFLEKGETLYLTEESIDYISNINVEYYIDIDGKSYLFLLKYVDPENRFASLYVEVLNDTFIVYKNDVEEFDLNFDGLPDVSYEVLNLDFPFVTAEINKYVKEETQVIDFDTKEKEAVEPSEVNYESSGGIWANYIKNSGLTRSQFFSLIVLGLMFVILMVAFGRQVISMIWKST